MPNESLCPCKTAGKYEKVREVLEFGPENLGKVEEFFKKILTALKVSTQCCYQILFCIKRNEKEIVTLVKIFIISNPSKFNKNAYLIAILTSSSLEVNLSCPESLFVLGSSYVYRQFVV